MILLCSSCSWILRWLECCYPRTWWLWLLWQYLNWKYFIRYQSKNTSANLEKAIPESELILWGVWEERESTQGAREVKLCASAVLPINIAEVFFHIEQNTLKSSIILRRHRDCKQKKTSHWHGCFNFSFTSDHINPGDKDYLYYKFYIGQQPLQRWQSPVSWLLHVQTHRSVSTARGLWSKYIPEFKKPWQLKRISITNSFNLFNKETGSIVNISFHTRKTLSQFYMKIGD